MISIITPTYNESKNIEKLVSQIDKVMKDYEYELIIVDDNSPDGTWKIAQELTTKYPIRLLIRLKDRGLSKSVVDGFKMAKGDIIGVMDADLSHPPELLPKLVEAVEDVDIVVASRLIEGGGTENWPFTRKLTSYIATMLCRPLTKVRDPMSGYFMIRKSVIPTFPLKAKGYKILLELLVKGNYKTVKEVPFIFRDRTAGSSKLTAKVNIEYLEQLFEHYWYKIGGKKWT